MRILREWRIIALAIVAAITVFSPLSTTTPLIVVSAIVFLASRPLRFRFDLPAILATAIVFFSALSALWSISIPVTFSAAVTSGALSMYFIVSRYVTTNRLQLGILASGYLAGCLILLGRLIELRVSKPETIRLNLLDVNANYAGYAFVAGFGVVVLLGTAMKRTKTVATVLAVVAVLLGVGIVMAGSRGSFVGLALLVVWLVASRLLKRPPLWALVIASAIVALTLAIGVIDRLLPVVENVLGRPTGTWSGRLLIWPIAREWWLDHFFIGSGASTLAVANPMGIGAHNLILELGAGQGIAGVALFLAFLWFTFVKQPPLLVGSFIAVSLASYLTGHWDLAPAAWVVLALFSRADLTTRVNAESKVARQTEAAID